MHSGIFKEMLEKKYGKEEAAKRIYATTDKAERCVERTLLQKKVMRALLYRMMSEDVSPYLPQLVLLPIAVSGADIAKLDGRCSIHAVNFALNKDFADNDSMKYAAIRNILSRKGKSVEILCNYEPAFHYVAEWWKQLYGESEGKDQKGIFPAAVDLTTDLHSMGQFIQDGSPVLCLRQLWN